MRYENRTPSDSELTVENTRSGLPTLRSPRGYVHSRYDPLREARRFIDRTLQGNTTTALVVSSGTGYVEQALREKNHELRVVAVATLAPPAEPFPGGSYASWFPTRKHGSLLAFLHRHISELDLAGIQTIVWEPAITAADESARNILSTIERFLSDLKSNARTAAHFGKRWVRNLFRNSIRPLVPTSFPNGRSCPAVVTASGPSLDIALPILFPYREHILLVAVASALPSVLDAGLLPDLVVHTDPGFYASLHLYDQRVSHLPVLMPLTAFPPPRAIRPVYLQQGTQLEQELYREAERTGNSPPPVRIAERPTVTATACDAALRITSGGVILLGLDLAFADIRTHCRPHAFEPYVARRAHRLTPAYDQWFKRIAPHSRRTGPGRRAPASFSEYERWFRQTPNTTRARLVRCSSVPADLGIQAIPESELGSFLETALTLPQRSGNAASPGAPDHAPRHTPTALPAAARKIRIRLLELLNDTERARSLLRRRDRRLIELATFVDLPSLMVIGRTPSQSTPGRSPTDEVSHSSPEEASTLAATKEAARPEHPWETEAGLIDRMREFVTTLPEPSAGFPP